MLSVSEAASISSPLPGSSMDEEPVNNQAAGSSGSAGAGFAPAGEVCCAARGRRGGCAAYSLTPSRSSPDSGRSSAASSCVTGPPASAGLVF